jgi:hypothetical protein
MHHIIVKRLAFALTIFLVLSIVIFAIIASA